MEPIQNQRLLLRDIEEDDWQQIHEYATDPEVVRYMEWGPNTKDETSNFIRRAVKHQNEEPRRIFSMVIILRNTNRLIGGCGLHVSNPENREGWIGYVLNRRYWKKGYATEAARALVKFGFNQLNLHRIFATCDVENVASENVLEKIGMKREGKLREHQWIKGTWRDSFLYAILKQEWETKT